MNRIKNICLTLLVSVTLLGCTKDFEQINKDPNNIEQGTISPYGLLQELVYNGTQQLLYRTWLINGELIQYTVSGTSNNAYHRYVITNAVASSVWNNVYRWAANASEMEQLAIKRGDVTAEAIALTLKALYVHNLTDSFGEIPYSEAFKGSSDGIIKPKFDSQQYVYEQLYADLERANELYAMGKAISSPDHDRLYNGDAKKWQRFNNSLYLRLLMRMSNRATEMGVASKINEIFTNPTTYPVFASNEDNATLYYDESNPFVNYFGAMLESAFTTTGRRPAIQVINMMAPTGDPRISIWFEQKSGADGWVGAESGIEAQDADFSTVSYLNKANLGEYSSPYSNMKYDEVLFIYSEAIKRGWIEGGDVLAEKYYNDAITASIRFWDSVDTSATSVSDQTISLFLANVPYDGTLGQILSQKYLSLFWCGFEGWHEYRRTGYPELVIGEGTQNDHILPRRFEYPINTASTNPDNYAAAVDRLITIHKGGDNMKTPMWWSAASIEAGIK